jgi:hypothetical protein
MMASFIRKRSLGTSRKIQRLQRERDRTSDKALTKMFLLEAIFTSNPTSIFGSTADILVDKPFSFVLKSS